MPYVEHVPPDVTAQIFWLKNRDPAHWRDAWQVDHALGKYIISDQPMSEEEWIRERATMIDVSPNQEDSGGQDRVGRRAAPRLTVVGGFVDMGNERQNFVLSTNMITTA